MHRMMTISHLLVKHVQNFLKTRTHTNFGPRNSNMTFTFEIDNILIIHIMVTPCHFDVKQSQNILKYGTPANFRSGNSNMTSVCKVDNGFINYS